MEKIPVLGELEQEVLAHLWKCREGAVKSVHQAVGKKRRISPNTIHSALERLRKKGLLVREKVSHAYVYRPAIERSELLGKWLNEMISLYGGGKVEIMVSAFADLTRTIGASELERLEAMILNVEKDDPRGDVS